MATTTVSRSDTPAGGGRGVQPIANYGLLADCNSAALVDRDGSIGWLCLPRYDSPAVFAGIPDPAERDRIREAILDRGWSDKCRAYAQLFESDELDAAALLMPLVGSLAASDERMRSTIEAIARDLSGGRSGPALPQP